MNGAGRARGTCGELSQGVTTAGEQVQLCLPIDWWAEVDLTIAPAAQTTVSGLDISQWKTERAIRAALDAFDAGPHAVTVTRHCSDLPPEKGLGSSTADVVAAARAVAGAIARQWNPVDLAGLAGAIEPSDGVAFDAIVAVTRDGRLVRQWDWWPTFDIVVVIPPGAVATAGVEWPTATSADRLRFDDLLDYLDAAASTRDADAFAAAATASAQRLQCDRPTPHFAVLRAAATSLGAAGLAAAHTGVVSGLLFVADDDGAARAGDAADYLRARLPCQTRIARARSAPHG